jgi:hypothetical protein
MKTHCLFCALFDEHFRSGSITENKQAEKTMNLRWMKVILSSVLWLLLPALLDAQGWAEHSENALKGHLSEFREQTVCIQIISPDTSVNIIEGPRASSYHKETWFRAGYLLMLSQAWFSVQMEASQRGFIEQKIIGDITLKQLLTHYSGYPRYPWDIQECDDEALISFVRQFIPPQKPAFQLSFTGISLTEKWLRNYFSQYPQSVFDSWGIHPKQEVRDSSQLAFNKVIRQSLPIDCWPFCMSCSHPGLYFTLHDAGQLIRQILDNKDIWKPMMQPEAKTPLPHLKMALGFQIAENIKKLPLAMLASSDNGNAVFMGISPNTNTGIIILGDTDDPVDNLGLKLMALFHRDILNFKP